MLNGLQKEEKQFLFLTNASSRSPKELQNKLYRMGLDIGEEHFYTSALATAKFLQSQAPGCSAYVIGDHGLYNALYDAGITINDVDPDYVVVGETVTYGYEHIITAMNLVNKGARLIATNTDITGPIEGGIAPACRAFVAPIEATTGKKAYYVGKPNPLMMRTGLQILGVHSSEAVMIGDRMDTDIIAGYRNRTRYRFSIVRCLHKRKHKRISISPKTHFKRSRRYRNLTIFEDCDKACSNLVSNAFL